MKLTGGDITVISIALLLYFIFEYKALGLRKVIIVVVVSLSTLSFIYYSSPSFQWRVSHTVKEVQSILSGNISSTISSGRRLVLWKSFLGVLKASPITGLTYS